MGCTTKLNDLPLTTADVVDVPVTLSNPDGSAYDLTDTTVSAWVGGSEMVGAVTIEDAADGLLTLRIDAPALGLGVGRHMLELRADDGEQDRLLIEARLLVRQSQKGA